MREVAVKVWDDLDFTRDKTKAEASTTVTVGLNGVWRELDLSETNNAELEKLLQPYLNAGRIPENNPRASDPQRGRRNNQEHIFRQGLREFAKANGFKYITETGKYYYRKDLKEAYAAYLAEKVKEEKAP